MIDIFSHHKLPNDAIEASRLQLLFEQTKSSGYKGIIQAGILTLLMIEAPVFDTMIFWFLFQFVTIGARRMVARKIQRELKKGKKQYSLYHNSYAFVTFFSGLYWGFGAYYFFPDINDVEIFVSFITIMAIMCAAVTVALAPSRRCSACMILPVIIGLSSQCYAHGLDILFYTFCLYGVLLARLVTNLNRAVIHSLTLNLENEKLIESVTLEKEFAQQANLEKSRFLAAASHDLSQPLNSMGLFIYTAKQIALPSTNNKYIKVISQIDNSYQALKSLFDSLLEISRLDAGTIHAEIKVTPIAFVMHPISDEMRELATDKGLDFTYHASNYHVKTDTILLSRILRNLIGNAIKYTAEGSVVVIEKAGRDFIDVMVIDSGIGIPNNELENIFNEYHQLANKKRDRRQGIGLGLALVKKMCEVLQASITVTSTLGEGSVFTLRLPRVDEKILATITRDTKSVSLVHLSILVIDDELDILQGMKLLLQDWGCTVRCAETYAEGLACAVENRPDIVLCDYRLQDSMTGIEAVSRLRENINSELPVIIISGDTNPELLHSVAANDYTLLSKPIDPDMLKTKISFMTQA